MVTFFFFAEITVHYFINCKPSGEAKINVVMYSIVHKAGGHIIEQEHWIHLVTLFMGFITNE